MKQKDKEWSGLLKIPDEEVIKQLRKELSEAKVKIGQLESYIEELESGKVNTKYLKTLFEEYLNHRVSVYYRAIKEHDNNFFNVCKRYNQLKTMYYTVCNNLCSDMKKRRVFVISKNKCELLNDLLLCGIAFLEERDRMTDYVEALYRNIKMQIKG